MQIAEYLADYLGTKISGTSAAICLLHKSSYGQYFEEVVLANVVDLRQSGREVMEIFETFVASLPEHEIERVRRVDRLMESRLDDTHPPTVFRIDFLNSHHIIKTAKHIARNSILLLELSP